jgi:hypothetical protein
MRIDSRTTPQVHPAVESDHLHMAGLSLQKPNGFLRLLDRFKADKEEFRRVRAQRPNQVDCGWIVVHGPGHLDLAGRFERGLKPRAQCRVGPDNDALKHYLASLSLPPVLSDALARL